MRCEHCGRDEANARFINSTHCAPPYQVRRHLFSGRHPADVRDASKATQERLQP